MENKYNIILKSEAEEMLLFLLKGQKEVYSIIIRSLQELSVFGLKSTQLKNIGNNIFRKRIGRWRLLFTMEGITINIWIIKIEKDTKKDYKKWKDYIISKM